MLYPSFTAEHVCKIEFRREREAESCCAATYIASDLPPLPGGVNPLLRWPKCEKFDNMQNVYFNNGKTPPRGGGQSIVEIAKVREI